MLTSLWYFCNNNLHLVSDVFHPIDETQGSCWHSKTLPPNKASLHSPARDDGDVMMRDGDVTCLSLATSLLKSHIIAFCQEKTFFQRNYNSALFFCRQAVISLKNVTMFFFAHFKSILLRRKSLGCVGKYCFDYLIVVFSSGTQTLKSFHLYWGNTFEKHCRWGEVSVLERETVLVLILQSSHCITSYIYFTLSRTHGVTCLWRKLRFVTSHSKVGHPWANPSSR